MASPPFGRSPNTALSTEPQGTAQSTTHTNPQLLVWPRLTLLLALLCAFALRLVLLDTFSLREDEALYGFWARSVWSDPRFLQTFPDKPPIFLWLQAVALSVFGATSAGARMVSILASTATVALVATGARQLWRSSLNAEWVMAAAAWLLALSPFAIAFAPTGYTDSLLVFFGTASIVLVLRGRNVWAGVLVAAAIFTKQQGLFYLPLILVLAPIVAMQRRHDEGHVAPESRGNMRRAILRVLGGAAAIALPILVWDASRWLVAPSPWDLGVQNYTAIGFSSAAELGRRAAAWWGLLWFGGASLWAWLLYFMLAVLAGMAWWQARHKNALMRWGAPLLALWVLAFLATHILSTVPAWDRYLLPIFPVGAMLLGGGFAWRINASLQDASPTTSRPRLTTYGLRIATVLLCLIVLLPPALEAARGNFPIGGDHGDYTGIDEAALFVQQESHETPVSVYHRALGWNLDFALFDAVRSGAIDLRWFPNGIYLADNITKNPARRAFVVEPDWATTRDLIWQAKMRGLDAQQIARFGKMTVVEITQPDDYCAWCANYLPRWTNGLAGPMSQP